MWPLIPPRVDTVSAVRGYRGRKAQKALQDEERKEEPGPADRGSRPGSGSAGKGMGVELCARSSGAGQPSTQSRGTTAQRSARPRVSAHRDPAWGSGMGPDRSVGVALENR